ncbi:MAG: amino acid permease [Spirochaetes bacterium]|nr:amino acid permease [Spirochaetota bacterium]
MELKRQLGLYTAVLIIIADVIGTGIFMTTGNVLGMVGSSMGVIALWAVGGLLAITGSMCYAELSSIWPDNGGEYVYLRNIFGFLPSFLTGWISLVVGFSASAAITSMTAVIYIDKLVPGALPGALFQKVLASSVIFIFGMVHIIGVRKGGGVQNVLTVIKLLIVFLFVVFGLAMADWASADRLLAVYPVSSGSVLEYGSALVVIMYAFSGWNGATYIAGEIKDPARNLPRALFAGTLIVTVVYLAMNVVFIMSSPGKSIMGENAIGAVAAKNLFGDGIGPVFTFAIIIILLSSVSVQMMIGPRVYHAMARDGMIFNSLQRINPRFQTPDLAIIIQMVITIAYVFIGMDSVISLLIYLGFSLGIFPLLSVIGLVVYRYRNPGARSSYMTPLFPLVPAVFICLSLCMMATSVITKTETSLFALGVVACGVVIFFVWQRLIKKPE